MDFILNLATNHRKKIIIVIVLSVLGIASTYVLGPDNAVEEGAEAIIQNETGVCIDFSPEKK